MNTDTTETAETAESEAMTGSGDGDGGGCFHREPGPSDSLRTFGAVVQALRQHAGLSRADFGKRVNFSKHTVESVELGCRMPDPAFVERADEALGNTGALRKAAQHLNRLERQRLLHERPGTTFDFILEEAVLVRRLGGTEVSRELLDHITALSSPRNTTLQIMPMNGEQHACLAGPVRLLETPDGSWRAYSEGQENGRLITGRKEVRRIQTRYARLRSQALSPKDSASLLRRMRGAGAL